MEEQISNQESEDEILQAKLPIEWHIPDDIITRYANNIVVQGTESEYFISFFEVSPPLILGSREEQVAKLRELDSIRANCVARIVVSREKMPEFIKTLQVNLERHRARAKSKEEEEEQDKS